MMENNKNNIIAKDNKGNEVQLFHELYVNGVLPKDNLTVTLNILNDEINELDVQFFLGGIAHLVKDWITDMEKRNEDNPDNSGR